MELRDQVALVCGGSRGIGREVVLGLAQRGAQVRFAYRERHTAADETVARVMAAGGWAEATALDVRDSAAVEGWVGATQRRFGRIDILVNSIGMAQFRPLESLSLAEWQAGLALNLKPIYTTCRAVIRPMMQRRYGRVVNIAALHGLHGFPGMADYSAATGGIFGFTRAMAREVAAWGITVNCVAPGLIASEQLAEIPEFLRQWCEELIALKRVGRPEEAAAAAIFLASPSASYITGQAIKVDGGWTMT